jgi:cation transport ATPase
MWNSEGAMVGWIGVDKIAVGIYSVGDQLRLEAVEAVKDLQVVLPPQSSLHDPVNVQPG